MKYKDAIKKSMEKLARDNKTIFVGYNLKYGSQAYGTLKDVPKNQILEMPVAENLMTGLAIGMSLEGFKPVLIFERMDFMLNASDAIINHLDKIKKISQFNPKVIIRAIIGTDKPFNPGIQHLQDFTKLFSIVSFPVIKLFSVEDIIKFYSFAELNENSIMLIEERGKYETAR